MTDTDISPEAVERLVQTLLRTFDNSMNNTVAIALRALSARVQELEGRHTAILQALDKIAHAPIAPDGPQICMGGTPAQGGE